VCCSLPHTAKHGLALPELLVDGLLVISYSASVSVFGLCIGVKLICQGIVPLYVSDRRIEPGQL
jgi:hypothetical protein